MSRTFFQSIANKNYKERDELCCEEILKNNIPSFLNNFKTITHTEKNNTISFQVSSDYISIGTEDDYVRTPLSGITSQKVVDAFHCVLPTKKIVDLIWKYAEIKLPQRPKGAPFDSSMFSTKEIVNVNNKINRDLGNQDKTRLIAGHKKDVVITNKLAPNNPNQRVAIYGWHGVNGQPIQGPSVQAVAHEVTYYDYSHGIRLIGIDCLLNGEPKLITEVLQNKDYCHLLSDEGLLEFLRY